MDCVIQYKVMFDSNSSFVKTFSMLPLLSDQLLNRFPSGPLRLDTRKFNSWSDNNGNIENVFTKDELLSNITYTGLRNPYIF